MAKYAEQITALEAKRASIVSRLEEIQDKAAGEGRTKDAEEKEEVTDLKADLKALDEELTDLRDLEKITAEKAVPAAGGSSKEASGSRAGQVVDVKAQPKLAPGIEFARLVKALGMAHGDMALAERIAKNRYGEDSNAAGALTSRANSMPGASFG